MDWEMLAKTAENYRVILRYNFRLLKAQMTPKYRAKAQKSTGCLRTGVTPRAAGADFEATVWF